jgi:cobalt-zinc-cadmium efflux system membrane fusion protein
VLATLEDPQFIQLQQDYLMAKTRLQYVTSDFSRQKKLNEQEANSEKLFQQATSEYETQKILVKSLAEKLRLININPESLKEDNISRSCKIYAPINGYVSEVNVNIGKYISPSDILFEIINPSDIHLSLTVFEKDVRYINKGQKVTCYTNNKAGETYNAEVSLISRNINDNRATEVHCHFEGPTERLLPGMFMNADIRLTHAKVTALPDDAVVKWQNNNYIFISKGKNDFVMTPVETGNSYNGYTEIKTLLGKNEVVMKNAYSLLMKMKNTEEG